MKTSQLVSHKNFIESVSVQAVADQCNHGLEDVLIQLKTFEGAGIEEHVEDLDRLAFTARSVLAEFQHALKQTENYLEYQIRSRESQLFEQSTKLYQEMLNDPVDYILNRKKYIDPDTQSIITARIRSNSDWQHAGMIIRPGRESYIEDMVASDPLYLVDVHDPLLDPSRELFTPEYQRRLRYYVIDDTTEEPIFKNLPQAQFGTIVSHNFFQYKTIDVFQRYLVEIHDLLKPGGWLGLTYNNCDFYDSVMLAEDNFHCYTPGSYIKKLAQDIGFDVVFELNAQPRIYWLELKKSGTKETIRGGQTLAEIVQKTVENLEKKSKYPAESVPDDIDNYAKKTYTDDDVLMLQVSAVILGIDTEEKIFSNYTPDKLDRLIDLRLNIGGIEIEKFNEKRQRMFNKRKLKEAKK